MKVLLINDPRKNSNTATALAAVAKELAAQGIEPVFVQVGESIGPGLYRLWWMPPHQEGCVYSPKTRWMRYVRLMAECDGLVIGSPVYYSGIAGTMKSFWTAFFIAEAGNYALISRWRLLSHCAVPVGWTLFIR